MHDTYMKEAIIESKKAYGRNEVPVGAIIVYKGEIIARAGNTKEENLDVCAHAEILAIREAGRVLGKVNLAGCTLYSTLEPCPMCMGAIILANIRKLVYGARDPVKGAVESFMKIREFPDGGRIDVIGGIMEEECASLLISFFRGIR